MTVIEVAFDRFRPRHPAADKDTEIAVAADVSILERIEVWARTQRQLTERVGKPLFPEVRAKALEIDAILKNQPR
jgi:hypothetical protein